MDPPVSSTVGNNSLDAENSSRRASFASHDSQTAADFINEQLQLEADAREALPYSFDSCTRPLGPLRQSLFSCLTCNPPPSDPTASYTPAGVCYSCSISCHGEHTLVELFTKRNFVCDCGSTRLPSTSPCKLRADPKTSAQSIHSEEPSASNKYNQNFRNRFCCCGEIYDPYEEKGTMFQCLGLGSVDSGGCGEDWYHPECLLGLPRPANDKAKNKSRDECADEEKPSADPGEDTVLDDDPPLPLGFPAENDFETFLCFKCLESNPWLKRYSGTDGFLPPVYRKSEPTHTSDGLNLCLTTEPDSEVKSNKRQLDSEIVEESSSKRVKSEPTEQVLNTTAPQVPTNEKHSSLPTEGPPGTFSLFVTEDFRKHLCHCATCFTSLIPHPQLCEEEEVYEPPLSDAGDGVNRNHSAGSQHTGSLLDRGEAALSNVDRVRAIEGVMAYNHLKHKVKEFLRPFADSGKAVGAEDIKAYFEKLRGDDEAIREAGARRNGAYGDDGDEGNSRREQSGY